LKNKSIGKYELEYKWMLNKSWRKYWTTEQTVNDKLCDSSSYIFSYIFAFAGYQILEYSALYALFRLPQSNVGLYLCWVDKIEMEEKLFEYLKGSINIANIIHSLLLENVERSAAKFFINICSITCSITCSVRTLWIFTFYLYC